MVTPESLLRLPMPVAFDRNGDALADQPQRIETRPIAFGDDWPGVFIRGDEALHFANVITRVIQQEREHPHPGWHAGLLISQLDGLADTLRSCSVGNTGWPP